MMRYLVRILLLYSLSAVCSFLPLQGQFALMGTADYMPNGCIMLTPDLPYSEGLAYSTTKLDLGRYFEIDFELFLGDKDEGADGIAFVIHDDPDGYKAFGTWGECLGYGRWNPSRPYGNFIAPSIAIEFDTYQNLSQNDPPCDHLAFLTNGSNWHREYYNAGDENFNLEDNRLHRFRFIWDPTLGLVEAYLDGELAIQKKIDLVEDIFRGETRVIWGFTASTGRKHNLQYFCLKRITYLDHLPSPRWFAGQ